MLKTVLALSLLLLALVISSYLFIFAGDSLQMQNRLPEADIAYKIAAGLNPFTQIAKLRIRQIEVEQEERLGNTEETNFDKETALPEKNLRQDVLGAGATIPVLLYHYIRVNPDSSDHVGFGLSVTPYNFAAQMDYLVKHSYHSLTLEEFTKIVLRHIAPPEKPILITFDDGYKDAYTQAYPILKERGLKAVNFVITGFVGGPHYLSWGEIKEMADSGTFEFGSHTVNHLDLRRLSPDRLKEELQLSKQDLEKHLNKPIVWLAYPYGFVNDIVVTAAKDAKYIGAWGTSDGTFESDEQEYALPRVRIGGGESLETFDSRLPWK